MIWRKITPQLEAALQDSPVVLVNGARQTGKTTLVQGLGHYLTFDDAGTLAAATNDPMGFLAQMTGGISGTLVLDEVQFAPQIFPAIKILVDRDRQPGRFLLTGSTNILLLPKISESLAGRMTILTLLPLAQAEITASETNFVDNVFAAEFPLSEYLATPGEDRTRILQRAVAGGYPEPLTRIASERRHVWFDSYLTTILQRDVREIAHIEGLTQMPRLLTLLASRCASILNTADISRTINLPYTTLQRYMTLLEATFLLHLLPSWSANLGNRAIKSPKIFLNDTGLIASLLKMDETAIMENGLLLGQIFENFVTTEILKLANWSRSRPSLFHWRTQTRQEVDLVLEGPGTGIVGIEIKASTHVSSEDFKGLKALADVSSTKFRCGVVLYAGQQALPFGPNFYAIPISGLWS